MDEDTSRKAEAASTFYVLCCVTERSSEDFPEQTRKALYDFNEKEVEYIKLVMEAILTRPEGKELPTNEALNLTSELKVGKLSMQAAEKAIELFVAKKWLKFCPR